MTLTQKVSMMLKIKGQDLPPHLTVPFAIFGVLRNPPTGNIPKTIKIQQCKQVQRTKEDSSKRFLIPASFA